MLLSVSVSAVNCKLVCMELKSWRIACMSVWLGSCYVVPLLINNTNKYANKYYNT
jgi:hypothetical protein